MSFSFFRRSTSFKLTCPFCGNVGEMESVAGDEGAQAWDGFETQCGRCGAALWILLKDKRAVLQTVRTVDPNSELAVRA